MYSYEAQDGTCREEQTYWKTVKNAEGKFVNAICFVGRFRYFGTNNEWFIEHYYADETGFHIIKPEKV